MTETHPQQGRSTASDDTQPSSGAIPPAPARLGRFVIQKEVGRGGFGIVYLAIDEVLNRSVALKIPRDPLDDVTRDRFVREAAAAAVLEHPGLVPVYEAGEIDGICYMATAFCDGGTLADWIRQQNEIPVRVAAMIVRDLAKAIQHAQDRGVVHRDVKPRNVMLVPCEENTNTDGLPFSPRITDFGLARIVAQHMEETRSSVILGTPCYMAPEQLSSGPNDSHPHAADLYSLGVILYELLTGRRPIESDNVVEIFDAVRQGEVTSVREYRQDVPVDLETVCLSCLRKLPAERYSSGAELAADLSAWLNGEGIKARRPGILNRISHWASSPSRLREAGLMSILLGLSIPLWIIFSIVQVAVQKLEAEVTSELIPHALILSTTLLLPLAWAGYKSLSGSRRWMKIGLFLSAVNLLSVIGPLMGPPIVFTDFYSRHPLVKVVVFTFMTLLFAAQTAQYLIVLLFAKNDSRS